MAKFCTHCGKATESDEQKFCMGCGKTLVAEQTPAVLPEATEVTGTTEAPQTPQEPQLPQEPQTVTPTTKTKKSNGIKIIIPIVAVLILVLAGLAVFKLGLLGNNDNTADENNSDNPKTEETVEGALIISNGDSVETDLNVLISVGENTFENEASLTVVERAAVGEEEGSVTAFYAIEVDDTPQGTVEVSLPLPEDFEGDMAVVGVENEVYSNATRETFIDVFYRQVPVEDGFAVVTLDQTDFVEVTDGNETTWIEDLLMLNVYAKGGKKYRASVGVFSSEFYYEDGHFSVTNSMWFTSLGETSGKAFLDDLEKVHQYYLDKSYTYHKRDYWPMSVNIKPMEDLGGFIMSKYAAITGFDPDKAWLSFAGRLFVNGYKSGDQLPLLTHEYFHFVQSNYVDDNRSLWFDEATATYFESQISNQQPTVVSQYWEKAYDGIFPGEGLWETEAIREGYARYPLAKYLANRYGEDVIRQIYLSLESGASVQDAIEGATLTSKTELLNPYYVDLASGNLSQEGGYALYKQILDGGAPEGLGKAMQVAYPDTINYEVEELMAPIEVGEDTLEIRPNSAYIIALEFPEAVQGMMNEHTRMTVECTNAIIPNLIKMKGLIVESYIDSSGIENYETIGVEASDQWSYMLVLVNDSEDVLESNIKVNLKLAPTMDELVGNWQNSIVSVEELYIDPEFEAAMTEMMEGLGDEMFGSCETEDGEPAQISSIEDIVGQQMHVVMGVTKITDSEGKFAYQADNEGSMMPEMEPIHFSYDKGILEAETDIDDTKTTLKLTAYYLSSDTVALTGFVDLDYGKGLLTMKIKVLGSKGRNDI